MILSRGRGWISGAIRMALYFGCRKHYSSLYRFLARARWCPDAVGRRVFEAAADWIGEVIEVAIDDTLCNWTGLHVWGAGNHIDPLGTIYANDVRPTGRRAFASGHSWVASS